MEFEAESANMCYPNGIADHKPTLVEGGYYLNKYNNILYVTNTEPNVSLPRVPNIVKPQVLLDHSFTGTFTGTELKADSFKIEGCSLFDQSIIICNDDIDGSEMTWNGTTPKLEYLLSITPTGTSNIVCSYSKTKQELCDEKINVAETCNSKSTINGLLIGIIIGVVLCVCIGIWLWRRKRSGIIWPDELSGYGRYEYFKALLKNDGSEKAKQYEKSEKKNPFFYYYHKTTKYRGIELQLNGGEAYYYNLTFLVRDYDKIRSETDRLLAISEYKKNKDENIVDQLYCDLLIQKLYATKEDKLYILAQQELFHTYYNEHMAYAYGFEKFFDVELIPMLNFKGEYTPLRMLRHLQINDRTLTIVSDANVYSDNSKDILLLKKNLIKATKGSKFWYYHSFVNVIINTIIRIFENRVTCKLIKPEINEYIWKRPDLRSWLVEYNETIKPFVENELPYDEDEYNQYQLFITNYKQFELAQKNQPSLFQSLRKNRYLIQTYTDNDNTNFIKKFSKTMFGRIADIVSNARNCNFEVEQKEVEVYFPTTNPKNYKDLVARWKFIQDKDKVSLLYQLRTHIVLFNNLKGLTESGMGKFNLQINARDTLIEKSESKVIDDLFNQFDNCVKLYWYPSEI